MSCCSSKKSHTGDGVDPTAATPIAATIDTQPLPKGDHEARRDNEGIAPLPGLPWKPRATAAASPPAASPPAAAASLAAELGFGLDRDSSLLQMPIPSWLAEAEDEDNIDIDSSRGGMSAHNSSSSSSSPRENGVHVPKRGTALPSSSGTTKYSASGRRESSFDEVAAPHHERGTGPGHYHLHKDSMEDHHVEIVAKYSAAKIHLSTISNEYHPPDEAAAHPEHPRVAHNHALPIAIEHAVESHNTLRKRHHAPSLEWDDELAEYAARAAAHNQAQSCMMHCFTTKDGGCDDDANMGQNIYWCSRPSPDAAFAATKAWYDEIDDPGYDFDAPEFTCGTGHFTQLVWVSTVDNHSILAGWLVIIRRSFVIIVYDLFVCLVREGTHADSNFAQASGTSLELDHHSSFWFNCMNNS